MRDSLRVALVVTRSDVFGGAVVHVRDLASGLQGLGHEVRVFIGGRGPMLAMLRDAGVDAVAIPALQRAIRPDRDVRALANLVKALAAWRPDLLHAHTAKSGLLARLVAATRSLPCVYTPHAWPFLDGVPRMHQQAYLRIEQAAGRLPASVINVCRYEERVALERGVGVARRHFVVHNGVPDVPDDLRADPRRQPPRLVVVARFERQKDHITLLRGLPSLHTREWQLDLVGDGPTRSACERAVASAGLSDRVRFLGEVHDVATRLAGAQVLILPSRWEAMPLTLLEAMRAGLPVVATDVGGVGEAVVDGVTGLLVPRGEVMTLAAALARLVDDPELRVRLGAAGRARYEARFSLPAMVAETTRVYRTTLLRHALGRPRTAPVQDPGHWGRGPAPRRGRPPIQGAPPAPVSAEGGVGP